jgi:hypothetical protein
MGAEIHDDPYHISVVRASLTRNIGNLYHELREEIELQFASEIPLTKGLLFFRHPCFSFLNVHWTEWTKMPAYKTVLQIVSGTTNLVFVGLPLCTFLAYFIAFNPKTVVRSRPGLQEAYCNLLS